MATLDKPETVSLALPFLFYFSFPFGGDRVSYNPVWSSTNYVVEDDFLALLAFTAQVLELQWCFTTACL